MAKGEKVMKTKKRVSKGLTRRDLLKASGVALGSLAVGGAMVGAGAGRALAKQQQCATNECNYPVGPGTTQHYTYPTRLRDFTLDMQPDLDDDEMRITFLGTAFPPTRRAQQMMSIFVEVGPWVPDPNGGFGKATDSFVFDCGPGSVTNYGAMGIAFSRMDKIFITHLHGDHMGDLTSLYCFGPANDRKWPLYLWGQSPSGVPIPNTDPAQYYQDGITAFCKNFREAMRWHTESFSFLKTGYSNYNIPTPGDWGTPPPLQPVGDDGANDGYGLVPIELDWTKTGLDVQGNPTYDNIAYSNNGVVITHFPVIHTRKGSMGYKLEWNGLSMIYTSDTRPETVSIQHACNGGKGVDVFIHEMILPPELLAMKNVGLTWPDYSYDSFNSAVQGAKYVEDCSHTPQGAFGYLLTQIYPRPRLTVISHFPVADDTIKCAMNSVRAHFPKSRYPEFGKDIIWSTDLMVLNIKKGKEGKPPQIEQLMGKVSDYTFNSPQNVYAPLNAAKYNTNIAQIDTKNMINPDDTYCDNGY
jgi:ribonuclease Z